MGNEVENIFNTIINKDNLFSSPETQQKHVKPLSSSSSSSLDTCTLIMNGTHGSRDDFTLFNKKWRATEKSQFFKVFDPLSIELQSALARGARD